MWLVVTLAPAAATALVAHPTKPGPYSFQMVGDSAAPRYEEGDTVHVDPHHQLRVGDWCVFWQDDRETARIGKLVAASGNSWHVWQLNPRGMQALAKAEWPVCHVIVGRSG